MGVNYHKRTNPLTPNVSPVVPIQLLEQLGNGLSIPMEVVNGEFILEDGLEKIKQDIYVVLSTPIGARVFQPDFGSMVPKLIFQSYTPILQSELKLYTETALRTWVPQINVIQVLIDSRDINNHVLYLGIRYRINGTNSEDSVKIALAMDDQIKLNPEIFTIGGKRIFKGQ